MRKEIVLAAALSAAFHAGVVFGFGTSTPLTGSPSDRPVPIDFAPDKPEVVKPDIADGDTDDLDVTPISLHGFSSPGLPDHGLTSIGTDALVQIITPTAYHALDLDSLPLGIPTGIGRNSGDVAKDKIIYNPADLDRKPKPRVTIKPDYPYNLRPSCIEGDVELLIVVDPTGRVIEASVISATNPEFANSAKAAVLKWRFEKGVRNGVAVTFKCNLPMHFSSPR